MATKVVTDGLEDQLWWGTTCSVTALFSHVYPSTIILCTVYYLTIHIFYFDIAPAYYNHWDYAYVRSTLITDVTTDISQ